MCMVVGSNHCQSAQLKSLNELDGTLWVRAWMSKGMQSRTLPGHACRYQRRLSFLTVHEHETSIYILCCTIKLSTGYLPAVTYLNLRSYSHSSQHHISLRLPIALDRFRPPLTLASTPTCPPALLILSSSGRSVGLWSTDMSTATPEETHANILRWTCASNV